MYTVEKYQMPHVPLPEWTTRPLPGESRFYSSSPTHTARRADITDIAKLAEDSAPYVEEEETESLTRPRSTPPLLETVQSSDAKRPRSTSPATTMTTTPVRVLTLTVLSERLHQIIPAVMQEMSHRHTTFANLQEITAALYFAFRRHTEVISFLGQRVVFCALRRLAAERIITVVPANHYLLHFDEASWPVAPNFDRFIFALVIRARSPKSDSDMATTVPAVSTDCRHVCHCGLYRDCADRSCPSYQQRLDNAEVKHRILRRRV